MWQELVRLSDEVLAQQEIAALNLACAVDLPGSETINFAQCRETLDSWAEQTRSFTQQVMPRF